MQQVETQNKTIVERIKLKKFGKMYLWFFKKTSSMFFPSFFHDACFMMSHLFGLTLISFVQNSNTASTTSFVSASFLFGWTARAHCTLVPSSSCILLLCLLLNILQFVPMSWPTIIRLWVEFETTILLTTFLALISSKL